jgi:hypothetical protein
MPHPINKSLNLEAKLRISDVLLACIFCLGSSAAHGATLQVGPGQTYPTVNSAVAAANDGDTILVQAGTYTNDFSEITHQVTLQSVGGMVTMQATQDIPNEKAILITDTDTVINGFIFTGAHVTDDQGANGAGIRYQGGNLTIQNCWFHNNQEGLLGDGVPGTILIETSEFDHNGDATGLGAGMTHNIYAGNNTLLDIESSYIHDAIVGHEIKSRAETTIVNNTLVMDGHGSTASYGIDLPNGGVGTITNTIIDKASTSENPVLVSYGEEGNWNQGFALTLQNVLLVNNQNQHIPTGVAVYAPAATTMTNTSVYGLTQSELTNGEGGNGTFEITGTTWLNARPHVSGKHLF